MSVVLVVGGCSTEERETDSTYLRDEVEIIKIDAKKARTVKMSEVFSGIRYLSLETREDHLIGRIQKVLFKDGNIFLLSGSSYLRTALSHCFY